MCPWVSVPAHKTWPHTLKGAAYAPEIVTLFTVRRTVAVVGNRNRFLFLTLAGQAGPRSGTGIVLLLVLR